MSSANNDTDADDLNPSVTISTAVSLYFPFLLCGVILFELILRTPLKNTFTPRNRKEDTTCPPADRSYGLFGWILPAIRISDDEIVDYCGLDSLCFLRLLRLGQKLALCGIAMSVFLFPFYATGTHEMEKDSNKENAEIDPLVRITMSNLSKGEQRLWASAIAMYVMSFFAMYLLWEEYKVYSRRRHEFLSKEGPQQYSVVINDLPKKYRSSQALSKYMNYLFPNHVRSCHVAVECAELEERVARRVEIRNALEHALAVYGSTGKRPTHKPDKLRGGGSVDSIQFYTAKLTRLNEQVAAAIRAIEDHERESSERLLGLADSVSPNPSPARNPEPIDRDLGAGPSVTGESAELEGVAVDGAGDSSLRPSYQTAISNSPMLKSSGKPTKFKSIHRLSAFVSFTSLKAAQSAQQLLQVADPFEFSVSPAPYPKEIVWVNIGTSFSQRQFWQTTSWTVTVLIILFWTVPSAFVSSLTSVGGLKELIPGLGQIIIDYPGLEQLLKQAGPMGLVLMTALAAYVFGILSRREGHPNEGLVAASLFSKLVYFQTFQIFFVSIIAGTVLQSLEQIIKEPGLIVTKLGTTMPGQATTFMAYIIIQIGLKLSIELLRVIPLALGLIYRTGAPKLTNRERTSPWLGLKPATEPGEFLQTAILPNYYLAILLIFAFCAIAPLLTYFAGFFLFMSDIIFRRQVLFVYDPAPHSTGVYWPKLHDCLVGALLLAQITFLGLITLKVAPGPIFISTILPFTTIVYYFYAKSLWPRTAANLPLSTCRSLDAARRGTRIESDWAFLDNVYLQPALLESEPLAPENEQEFQVAERGSGGETSAAGLISPSDTESALIGRGEDYRPSTPTKE